MIARHTGEHPVVRPSRRPGGRRWILVAVLVGVLVVALGVGIVLAQPRTAATGASLTGALTPGATVDWTRGVVRARGVGPADRHAPSPAVARVAAERRAVDQARGRLAAAIEAVPRQGGALSAAAREVVAAEIARAPVVARDLGTDGSVTVELGLGLEALRQAAAGPRSLTAGAGDGAATTYVVDGRAAGVRPSVGLAIGEAGGAAPWTGPMVFATEPPGGKAAVHAVRSAAGGVLTVDGPRPPAGARVVVVVTP